MTKTHTPRGDRAPTVLVVDDERELADLYADWLQDSYAVRTAYSGDEALSHLDESVDVALVDRRMPGLSGDEVLERIREEGLNVQVAIVSAVTPDFDVIGMGFDDYLVKPVHGDDLRTTVERLLQYRKYDEQIHELEQLVAAKTALEAEGSYSVLGEHDEYQQLNERIEGTRAKVDEALATLEDEPVDRLLRELTTDGPGSPGQGGDTP